MIDIIAQIGVLFTGLVAVYLSASQKAKIRMYGGLFGLAGEPFWFITSYINNQFGIMILAIVYAFMWLRVVIKNYNSIEEIS